MLLSRHAVVYRLNSALALAASNLGMLSPGNHIITARDFHEQQYARSARASLPSPPQAISQSKDGMIRVNVPFFGSIRAQAGAREETVEMVADKSPLPRYIVA